MSEHVIGHYIDGKHSTGTDEAFLGVFNPATGERFAKVSIASTKVVNEAVTSSKKAFDVWSQTPVIKRARVLYQFKQLLEAHTEELAHLVTKEHGKTLADAKGSIARGIEIVEHATSMPSQLRGSFSENVANGVDTKTLKYPLGVCVGITPFNFPVMIPLWLAIPAIACGNTFVLKPSEKAPSVVIRLAELLTEAGCPKGVLNVINGDGDTAQALITHPDVEAVAAVGSTPIAKIIYEQAILSGKRAHTFGGAKNHAVVMPDVNVQEAASQVVTAAYGAAGERCMALSVAVVIGDELADKFVSICADKVKTLNIGPGVNDPDMGPLVTEAHLNKVLSLVDKGTEEGATLVVDGRTVKPQGHENGFFMGGCLFDNVTPEMEIYKAEIFGPVLCVMRVNSIDEAISLINQNQYGNGATIFTNNGAWAREFSNRVTVGMVGVNVPIPVPIAYHTFGGWKSSSFGDIGLHGDAGVTFYTKEKSITTRWHQPKGESQFSMPTHK